MFAKAKFPDGARLLDTSKDKLWLVFGGVGHHVACNDVYSRLFKVGMSTQRVENSKNIKEGDSLLFGTCLVRGQGSATIYFLTVHLTKIKLHPIYDVGVAEKYGFDYSLCRQVSWDLMKTIPRGPALT